MNEFISAAIRSSDRYTSLIADALWKLGISPLGMVDDADLYVEVFETLPSADFEKAQQREIPTWLFTPDESNSAGRVFTSDTHLLELIFRSAQTFVRPQAPEDETVQAALQPADAHLHDIPEPPEFYIAHPYILTRRFFGRAAEKDLLNKWVQSKQGMFIVEAIGGMGKSALTWDWAQQARESMPQLAGMMWWSFYEGDATVSNFLRHLLIYTTRRSPAEIDALKYDARLELLKQQLRQRPYLIVLDGLERILTAYHRMDAPHLLDEKVSEMQKDTQLRSCIDPRHATLLKMLSECHPSKVLISTRLIPSDLQNKSGHILDGIQHHNLAGLMDADVVTMMEHYGVQGNPEALKRFVKLIDNHSLLVAMLAGRIRDDASGDFAQWKENEGGELALESCSIGERRARILHYALSNLPTESRKLMGQLSAFRYPVDHRAVVAMNPFISPPPIKPPVVDAYERQVKHLETSIAQATNDQLRESYKTALQQYIARTKPAYDAYKSASQAYESSPDTLQGRVKLHLTLLELERLGLLSWDRVSNRFDLHPVVRAYAIEVLPREDKVTTYQKISDYFKGIPAEDLNHITEISDLRRSIEIFHALLNAEMLEEASRFLDGPWKNVLNHQLEAYYLIIELVLPFFKNGIDQPPPLQRPQGRLHDLGNAYYLIGDSKKALVLKDLHLKVTIDNKDAASVRQSLFNFGNSLRSASKYYEAHRVALLELELALASQDRNDIAMAWQSLMNMYRDTGHFDLAQKAYKNYLAAPRLHQTIFWQAVLDWQFARAMHVQGYNARMLAELALEEALATNHALVIRFLRALLGKIALKEHKTEEAEQHFLEHIALTKKIGLKGESGYGGLAKVRIQQKRFAEARQFAEMNIPFLDAAEVYQALGQYGKAREFALKAYRGAWNEGPPYAYWENLHGATLLLKELRVTPPIMLPFSTVKADAIPYEKEIQALIHETQVSQRKRRLSAQLVQRYRKQVSAKLVEFAGSPVEIWEADQSEYHFDSVIYSVSLKHEEVKNGVRWTDKFADFLSSTGVDQINGLIIGNWERIWQRENADRVIQALVVAAPRLPNLRAIFLGVIERETESESEADDDVRHDNWIQYTDVSPLFEAYPALEHFAVRGTNGLILGSLQHQSLKSLLIQTPGFPHELMGEITSAQLPSLEHLELWLGTRGYGATVTLDDIKQLVTDKHFPALDYLGLRNSEISDEIADVIAQSEVMYSLETLDLSLGILGDTGAQALLNATALNAILKLDIHHHYCSPAMMEKLEQLSIKVDVSDQKADKLISVNLDEFQLMSPPAVIDELSLMLTSAWKSLKGLWGDVSTSINSLLNSLW